MVAPSPLTRRLVAASLLALLLSQWLALLHAVEHGPRTATESPVAQAGAASAHAHDDAHAHAHDGVWGHGAGDAACQLVDQLLGHDAPGCVPPAAAGLPAAAPQVAALAPAAALGPVDRPYEARAPPRG